MNNTLFALITTQFVAKDDSTIRCQIFKKGVGYGDGEDNYTAGEFSDWNAADWRVPAEEPIVIEWSSDKKETIIGSTCTVTLVSPYDGALQPLYTTDPKLYCCLISRKAYGADSFSNIWFGWLDPEFYEEPFIAKKDYEVTLTFSDFGILKRLIATEPGTDSVHQYSVQEYVWAALGLIYPGFDQSTDFDLNICNTFDTASGTGARYLKVDFANFTDEDGETMTWYDVLEAVLKPLSLRIEQRAGKFCFYDLHSVTGNYTEFADTHKFVPIYRYAPGLFGTSGPRINMFDTYSQRYENDGTYLIMTDAEISDAPSILQSCYSLAQNEDRVFSGPSRPVGYTNQPLCSDQLRVREVEWTSNDQMLAVDETYNRVKVTFSPYGEAVLFDPEKEVQFETTNTFKNIKNGYEYESDEEYDSFQLSTYNPPSTADVVKGGITVCGGTTLFKIKSLESGSDCEGVVAFLGGYNHNDPDMPEIDEQDWNQIDHEGFYAGFRKPLEIRQDIIDNGITGQPLYRTRRIMIPNANGDPSLVWDKKMLKIQIPMLYDERYNPWEQADSGHNNLSGQPGGIKRSANSIGLRLNIRLYKTERGGTPVFYYQNIAWVDLNETKVTMQSQINADATIAKAGWNTYLNHSGSNGLEHVQYLPTLIMYSKFDGSKVDNEDSPCLGGMQDGGMPFNNNCETDYYFRKNNDGLYIPFPSIPSNSSDYQQYYWMEVEVTDGLYVYDKGRMRVGSGSGATLIDQLTDLFLKSPAADISSWAYGFCRWWLVGFPTIKVVENVNKVYEEVEQDDIEASGVIDASAAEELSIDTICGSIDSPIAKGAYISDGKPATKLRRGIRRASVEHLLIGTLYSQYAGRHLKLSGTARAVLPIEGLRMLKDSHYPDKRFLVTSEVYNVIDGESEITMVEASPDSYTSN